MIESLHFKHVGPSPDMKLVFAKRLNLLTGDNGLGKTFVLDAAWWALTRTWAENRMILPDPREEVKSSIAFEVVGLAGKVTKVTSAFDYAKAGDWKLPRGKKPMPGLVIYARVDGGFSIWDPARNYWRDSAEDSAGTGPRPLAYNFNRRQIWNGLWRTEKDEFERNKDALICRGLLEDVVTWQHDPDEIEAKTLLNKVMERLSPIDSDGQEPLRFGPVIEPLDKTIKVPSLIVPYSETPVPLERTSAGVRRVAALAYALVWAWTAHRKAVRRSKGHATAAHQIVLLFDEIEAHLHPKWQRSILPALMGAVEQLSGKEIPVQIIGTTHAPLVLASMETHFDEDKDTLFNLKVSHSGDPAIPDSVQVSERIWAMEGDAANWLMSGSFELKQARSREAQVAMEAAKAYMRGDLDVLRPPLNTAHAIDQELRRVLASHDRFWPRWIIKSGQHHEEAGL